MQASEPGSSQWQVALAPETAGERWGRRALFLRNFFKHPRMVGSFLQSSPHLIERLLAEVDWVQTRVVVEFGPGTGVITTELLRRMEPWARLLAIETNVDFVHLLRETLTDRRAHIVQGKALDVRSMLTELDLPRADVIISGIPFSTMSPDERRDTLEAAHDALQPGGQLIVYQYSRKVLADLAPLFDAIEQSVEWKNGMPMQVFTCRKANPLTPSAATHSAS